MEGRILSEAFEHITQKQFATCRLVRTVRSSKAFEQENLNHDTRGVPV